MIPRAWKLRAAALLATGAVAVHQLRYALAFRAHAGAELHHQGHGYLLLLAPLLAGGLAIAVAHLMWRLAVAAEQPSRLPGKARLSLGSSACLIGIYTVQEWLEGMLSAGHPGGLAGVFGHGGWLAIPLSLVIGALIAVALRGSARVASLERAPRIGFAGRAAPLLSLTVSLRPHHRKPAPCARFLAPRGPPLLTA